MRLLRVGPTKWLQMDMIEDILALPNSEKDKTVLEITMFSGRKHTIKCRSEDAEALIKEHTMDQLELRP